MSVRRRVYVALWIPLSVRFGGRWADGTEWKWVSMLRWRLSYHLGIGSWFRDGRDDCEVCGGMPSDMDFWMERVGRKRARCASPECLSASQGGDGR